MYKLQRIISRNTVKLYKICRFSTTDLKTEIKDTSTKTSPPISPVSSTSDRVPETSSFSNLDAFALKPAGIPTPPFSKDVLSTTASFDEVPGPKILEHLATAWSFIPTFGNQMTTSTIQYILGANKLIGSQLSWGGNAFLFRWLLDEYGPIVRLRGPFGGDVLVLSRPEDAMTVFVAEGRYPVRSSLDCLEKYRLEYRKMKHAGPFLMHGEEWEKLRIQIITPLNKAISYQFKVMEATTDDFIARIKKIKSRQDEVPPTFVEELYKWSLESLCAGTKFGFMTQPQTVSLSESSRMLQGFYGATEAVRKCESGLHLWKYIETPAWKTLVQNCETIDGILNKYLLEAEHNLHSRKENGLLNLSDSDVPLIEAMLLQDGISREDILTVLLDMILIGVNAISHSAGFLFYHLARCPRAQRILTDEVRTSKVPGSSKDIQQMTYLQACVKESLRLKPPIPFLSRINSKDIVINNYRIPKGTVILMATYLSSLREENFDDALKFIPERWVTGSVSLDLSFASMPFGYGPKACLAKNLAEMQLGILITKILSSFKIEYHYGDISSTNKLLASPNKSLKFRFVNRII